MPPRFSLRSVLPGFVLLAAACACSCDVPVGPGYKIEQQTVRVHFLPAADPKVEIEAEFALRNTGDEPLASLEIHLPPADRVRLGPVSVVWETQAVAFSRRKDPAGDILQIATGNWPVKHVRSLRVDYVIVSGGPGATQLDVAQDAFYLPPGVWLAAPMKPPGIFGSGGSPPSNWTLEVRAPSDFAAQASGELSGASKRQDEEVTRFQQHFPGILPFVIAGRYRTREYKVSPYPVYIWSKGPRGDAEAQSMASDAASAAKTFDAVFGPREDGGQPLWIADLPVAGKEITGMHQGSGGRGMLYLPEPPGFAFVKHPAAELAGQEAEAQEREIAAELSKRWQGYGLSGDPEELPQPLGSLPAYGGCLAREAVRGPEARKDCITEALREQDKAEPPGKKSGEDNAGKGLAPGRGTDVLLPAKGLLFFFALEDQFGRGNLHAALQHMVQARRGRGYDIRDLIAALEQETNRNVAEFVRLWVKHPGIPADFRARYATKAAQ